jgi:hypothetical protein
LNTNSNSELADSNTYVAHMGMTLPKGA